MSVYIDKSKKDYVLFHENGSVSIQDGPFRWTEPIDWNCDGDTYRLFGASFLRYRSDGSSYGKDFWTPEEIADAYEEGQVLSISRMSLLENKEKASLDELLKHANARKKPEGHGNNKGYSR